MRLNENDRWALINALQMAADQSQEFARAQARVADALRRGERVALFAEGEPGAQAADALASQFKTQRAGYLNYVRLIEDAEYIDLGDPTWLGDEGEDEPDVHAVRAGDAEPCCYGFVTSGGQVHEPDCRWA